MTKAVESESELRFEAIWKFALATNKEQKVDKIRRRCEAVLGAELQAVQRFPGKAGYVDMIVGRTPAPAPDVGSAILSLMKTCQAISGTWTVSGESLSNPSVCEFDATMVRSGCSVMGVYWASVSLVEKA